MRTSKILLALSLVMLFAVPSFAQYYVYDQSYKDPSFVRFKIKLLESIMTKDTSKLFALLDDKVHIDDEDCSYAPNECFKQQFRTGSVKKSDVWNDLFKLVSYGFSKSELKEDIYRLAQKGDVIFQAPSYLKQFDDNQNNYLLVLGQNVNIREKPTMSSNVIAQATFQKLRYNDPMSSGSPTAYNLVNGKTWYEVILDDGRKGYIIEDYVSAGIKKELSVKKVNGQWKIISYYSPSPKC